MNETGKPSGGNSADLVVYGKIFTSENQTVEAFAVKDGRYVYAGDRKGARAFIEEGKTEVIDHTGKDADFLMFDNDLLTAEQEGFGYNKLRDVYFRGKKMN